MREGRRGQCRRLRRMSENASPAAAAPHEPPVALRVSVYRYFFYGWLFRDADHGSGLERATALRHNRDQARWLPLYMLRWCVSGVLLAVVEQGAERTLNSPVVAAALLVALVFVVLYLLITVICWLFLQIDRQSRRSRWRD